MKLNLCAAEFWPIWQESKEGQDAYTKYWPDEISEIATRFAEAYLVLRNGVKS